MQQKKILLTTIIIFISLLSFSQTTDTSKKVLPCKPKSRNLNKYDKDVDEIVKKAQQEARVAKQEAEVAKKKLEDKKWLANMLGIKIDTLKK